ncbi:erythrocyte membrane protein 1 [Plasmodium falciparum IGH-CR14]|uniref:Erythrocyte membrane protein 1 n=1 Tax=Plasmodium falciparum IGH-CR14 TaxID=580059 RepID=A0A0L1I447_PLAFA|nr:erythrocyte membrane protein 1 [Plasmodium falciparum IGH-CR14]
MAPPSAVSAPRYDQATSAKELFDMIGETVQKKVHDAGKKYYTDLHGDLTKAKFDRSQSGQQTENDPCKLLYQYHTDVKNSGEKEYPCKSRSDVRFSDTKGAECDYRKIRDSDKKNNSVGACAPFRRLHLCDYNLENINDYKNITNDTLLVDVCLAALHEGQSISVDHPRYHTDSSGSTICTVLARSFADIGDIIRGKDLYLGNPQESAQRKKLEENLQKIFRNIYEKLLEENQTNGKNGEIETRYNDGSGNYYQLREDWWEANRETIWRALTCHAPNSAHYTKMLADGSIKKSTWTKCRDVADVPTNFDYVPQYLRWFEEWGEDFCRKKNKKIKDVKRNCREQDKSGTERYCDRDGFDCERTIYKKGYFVIDKDCNTCSVWCRMYESWIDNQKKEFLKQKEKYTKEITSGGASGGRSGNGRTKGGAGGETATNYEGYEKKFYDELQSNGYGTIDKFLNLLSKEKTCKDITDGGKIDFKNVHGDAGGTAGSGDSGTNNENEGTFYHSKYCDSCPECGVKKGSDGQFVNRTNDDAECKEEKEEYNIPTGVSGTKINVLYSGKCRGDITEKLKDFCENPHNEDGEKNEQWECYYKNETEDKCRMKKAGANDQGHDKIMSFNDFFNFWVGHVLNDSIDWRTQLTKCLSEDKLKKCEKGCKSNCECFKKWIEKKEKEWEKIKEHFKKQKGIPDGWTHYILLEKILEDYYFENIQKAYGDLKSIQEMKKMIEEHKKNPNRTKDDEDAIDVLFDHEKEEAEDCLDIHEDDDDDDECVEESEKIPNNPCSGTRHRAMVKNVAAVMHLEARQQLTSRGGGRKALRGDASQGTYSNLGQGNQLKDICKITANHSNDSRIGNNGGACKGKDGGQVRFKIGTPWTNIVEKNKTSYKDVFLPPRREHMCTSNLENLSTSSKGLSNGSFASHSLLGDVLLAAKYEADKIIDMYKEKNNLDGPNGLNNPNDQATVCRAVRYSFADIGDIIRGRDMWDKDDGSKKMEGHLKKIFNTIRQKLPKEIKEKYNGDENNNPPYKKLREDWWTANRRQVWKAMKCAMKNGNIDKCNVIPLDDYIPQRLRWMTEWAEWFCKEQKKQYEGLMVKCKNCQTKGKSCTQEDGDCGTCTAACTEYNRKIQPWKDQWNTMEIPYALSYLHAKNDSPGMAFGGTDPDYQQVVHFFKELQKTIRSSSSKRPKRSTDAITTDPIFTSPYFTAAGYIHQELPNVGCKVQDVFCNNNGNNGKYAFKDPPKEYEEACGCKSRPKPEKKTEKPKEEEDPECKTVNDILKENDGNEQVEDCHPKEQGGTYPGWKCDKNSGLVDEDGVCMPPRRQKLCLHYLKKLTVPAEKKEEGLKTAFIKTAAAETFLSWQYYKSKHGNGASKLDEELKKGKIPEEFLRSMFFTYADYRDICLDKDISKKVRDVKDATDNIGKFFSKDGKLDDLSRQDWWNKHKDEIWKGMLCALTKYVTDTDNKRKIKNDYSYDKVNQSQNGNPSLEDFAKKPQFLRWMIEWGEEFCVERQKKENKIKDGCSEGDACNTSNHPCKNACTEYEKYVENKKKEFKKQTDKFVQKASDENPDKEYTGYEYKPGIESKQGNDYLLNNCDNKKCDCMKGNVLTAVSSVKPFGIYAHKYPEKCNCLGAKFVPTKVPPAQQPQEPPPAGPPVNVCDTVKSALTSGNLNAACSQKYSEPNRYWGWRCIAPSGSKSDASGSICVPPRRRKLYVGHLEKWANSDKTEASSEATSSPSHSRDVDLLKAFVESAAVETFFLWHKYKVDKEREEKEKNTADGTVYELKDDNEEAQKQLNGGTIPEEFLRQMFYTLGDYRNICLGNDMGNDNYNKNISTKVRSILNSGETPEEWWQKHGPQIWEGMLCALSYDTKERTFKDEVHKKLTEHENNKNTYGNVTITSVGLSGDNTVTDLSKFSEKPQFIRWLEEWGEEFCRKQKHKLYIIKKDCRDNKFCSGDGVNCNEIVIDKDKIFDDLKCNSCAKSCSSYRKWINKKKDEFHKQDKIYKNEIEDAKLNNHDNGFCKTLKEKYSTLADFLSSLKGPCCETNTVDTSINFKDTKETFKHATNCDPCSEFKVNCQNDNCTAGTQNECNGKTAITAKKIKQMRKSTDGVSMLVSDDSTNGVEGDDLKACIEAGIFKGIKKDVWKCGEYCGVDICTLKKNNNGEEGDEKPIIMKEFLKRWLENFFEDNNRIRKKLKLCTNSGKGSKCIKECVDKWIEEKRKEWEEIKKKYIDTYKIDDGGNDLKTFLEGGPFRSEVDKAIKPCKELGDFEKSKKCAVDANSKSGEVKKKDIVECLLKKLGEKAKECKDLPSDTECSQEQTLDLDDQIDEDPENKVAYPKICGDIEEQKEEEESGCEEATATPKEPATPGISEETNNEENPVLKPEEEATEQDASEPKQEKPAKGKKENPPKRPIQPPYVEHPLLKPALMSSTIMWSVGIGFAALSYFYLKKKTKSSVGNLFQILQIPKGDYDIPTLKSSNRYIPYASDRHKGKTYIYMEGDSGTDSGYTDHYSDITSSESEYEELDINEIYPYQSPKYKTLIEVILEPSKRDIQSDDTPSNKFTDNEWNQLKKDFISNMLQNTQNTEPNILHNNVDNNTHPTMSRHKVDQKPFIMSIHDRNLYIGEEYSYDMSTNSGENNLYSGENNLYSGENNVYSAIDPTSDNQGPYSDKNDPISDNHHPYSGIDLINDALNGDYDLYDEILKRKENELFGTNHVKHTSTHSVAKNTNSDPITNQLELFHKWLDRHRNMCEKWKNKEDILNKLKEEWNKENNNNVDKTYNSDNKPSHNHVLNTDVSIQIDMDNPKTKNEITNMDTNPDKSTMDTILDDLEKYNEPYYYDFYKDDIYYDVNDDDKTSVDHINMDHNKMDNNNSDVPTKVQIEMNIVNNKKEIFEEKYPISDIWNI